jgi:RHS repeat-associated protein
LIGRSVWNTRWLLIIPAGTLHNDRNEGIQRFINGALLHRRPTDGTRDGNGVSRHQVRLLPDTLDLKIFFQTRAAYANVVASTRELTVAGGGLEIWPLQLPAGVTVWRYAAASACWQPAFAGDLASMGTLPPRLAPGEAIYVHTDGPVELAVPDPALGIAYYHQDHLGSSSAVTDAAGALAEETSYYPFGAARHEERWRPVEAHYQFTQKERDRESGLSNFGHRFYHPVTGRWLSPDPKGESGGSLNLYAYCNQNPLKHYDPDGAEIKVTRTMNPKTKATESNSQTEKVVRSTNDQLQFNTTGEAKVGLPTRWNHLLVRGCGRFGRRQERRVAQHHFSSERPGLGRRFGRILPADPQHRHGQIRRGSETADRRGGASARLEPQLRWWRRQRSTRVRLEPIDSLHSTANRQGHSDL